MRALPFAQGTTFHGEDGTIDTSDYAATHLEGMEVEWLRRDPTTGQSTDHVCRGTIMRNITGSDLSAGQAVAVATALANRNKRVAALVAANGGACAGIVDDTLGYAVRNGDLFICVQQGPARHLVPDDKDDVVTIALGDKLYGSAAIDGDTGFLRPYDDDDNALTTSPGLAVNVVAVATEIATNGAAADAGALKKCEVCIQKQ